MENLIDCMYKQLRFTIKIIRSKHTKSINTVTYRE